MTKTTFEFIFDRGTYQSHTEVVTNSKIYIRLAGSLVEYSAHDLPWPGAGFDPVRGQHDCSWGALPEDGEPSGQVPL